jgi:hypothetical protein
MLFKLIRIHVFISTALLFVGQLLCTAEAVQYTTDHFRLTLSGSGQIENFVDLRNGKNYANAEDTRFCVLRLQKYGAELTSDNVAINGDMLTFSFPGTLVTVKLQVTEEKSYLIFDVAEIAGGNFYALQFARVPLTVDDTKDDFAACAMSRKMNTNTLDYPGKSNLLGGQCYSTLGYEGSGVFLLGMHETQLHEAMKKVADIYTPGEMPINRAGGPYAMDHPKNYGSYFINETPITENQVDGWIETLSRFGVDQVDFQQGTTFRQGDFYFNPTYYPNGVSDFRKTSEAFRKHGIITGLHTYAEFISEQSKHVTPVPHKDLDVMRSFTLSRDMSANEQTVPVDESTGDVSEITGFFVRNSKVIRIDDELILFEKPSHSPPYGFTSCTRGAFGTMRTAHSKGARVEHLTQMFFLFAPKAGSELFLEIARETARTYNEGGFEMIYLDALDGTFALVDDYELIWYYDALFVNEVLKHTEIPPLLEYSTFSPIILYGRSRMGAWDEARRGYRRFFDKHIEINQRTADRLYLPGQMGWQTLGAAIADNIDNFQEHIMFPEDVEYLGAKTLAYNYGLSYIGINPNNTLPRVYRNADILKKYDSLRRVGHFATEMLERLRDPNADFLLQRSGDDWRLSKVNYAHVLLRPDAREFSYHNPFQEQTPMIRIEHRHMPVAYDSPEAIDLLPLNESQPVQPVTVREFVQPVDLSNHLGMGLWVYGDGGGQVVNVRVESPAHLASGFTDHIVEVDFTGWRYFALAEADNGKADDVDPNNPNYNEYRQTVFYNSISKVQLIIKGETKNLRFRTVRALPLKETHLVDPVLQTDEQTISFRGYIKTGHYMEFTPGARAVVYDAAGREISEMQPNTPLFKLPAGNATIKFSGVTVSGNIPGVRITLCTNENPTAEKGYPTIPTDLYATYGQILADVALPAGWSWMNETLPVGNVGIQMHKAKFTPNATEDYVAMTNVDLQVTVEAIEIPSSSENLPANSLHAWIRDGLLHVCGLTPGKMLSVYTVTGVLDYHSIATSVEANIKLKTPGMYIVQSEEESIKVVFE